MWNTPPVNQPWPQTEHQLTADLAEVFFNSKISLDGPFRVKMWAEPVQSLHVWILIAWNCWIPVLIRCLRFSRCVSAPKWHFSLWNANMFFIKHEQSEWSNVTCCGTAAQSESGKIWSKNSSISLWIWSDMKSCHYLTVSVLCAAEPCTCE